MLTWRPVTKQDSSLLHIFWKCRTGILHPYLLLGPPFSYTLVTNIVSPCSSYLKWLLNWKKEVNKNKTISFAIVCRARRTQFLLPGRQKSNNFNGIEFCLINKSIQISLPLSKIRKENGTNFLVTSFSCTKWFLNQSSGGFVSLFCSWAGFSVHGSRLTTLLPSFEGQTTN